MITIYLLIAAFTFGKFYGEIEPFDVRPGPCEWFWLAILSLAWPLAIYIHWKDQEA